ncbi:hypothetical protein [Sinomonas halotolerans]|uniref:DoxX family membrane protein n=1 Tax=Sinomonas halotolerans TaxID=1644133 RepID=A0ABU9X111_9MICC
MAGIVDRGPWGVRHRNASSVSDSPAQSRARERAVATQSIAGARALAVLRITLGFIFIWAFFDKLLGLGFSTPPEKSVLSGGSPTTAYISGLKGTLSEGFHTLANQPWVDWLYMVGVLGLGLALITGVALRVATVGGVALLLLMWLSVLPIRTNPFVDQHIIYALVLIALTLNHAGDTWGLGRWVSRTVGPRTGSWLR